MSGCGVRTGLEGERFMSEARRETLETCSGRALAWGGRWTAAALGLVMAWTVGCGPGGGGPPPEPVVEVAVPAGLATTHRN